MCRAVRGSCCRCAALCCSRREPLALLSYPKAWQCAVQNDHGHPDSHLLSPRGGLQWRGWLCRFVGICAGQCQVRLRTSHRHTSWAWFSASFPEEDTSEEGSMQISSLSSMQAPRSFLCRPLSLNRISSLLQGVRRGQTFCKGSAANSAASWGLLSLRRAWHGERL